MTFVNNFMLKKSRLLAGNNFGGCECGIFQQSRGPRRIGSLSGCVNFICPSNNFSLNLLVLLCFRQCRRFCLRIFMVSTTFLKLAVGIGLTFSEFHNVMTWDLTPCEELYRG